MLIQRLEGFLKMMQQKLNQKTYKHIGMGLSCLCLLSRETYLKWDAWDAPCKYICVAIFSYEGFFYDMLVRLWEMYDIYAFLGMVMGIPHDTGHTEVSTLYPFDSILEFEDYYATMEEVAPWTIVWHLGWK